MTCPNCWWDGHGKLLAPCKAHVGLLDPAWRDFHLWAEARKNNGRRYLYAGIVCMIVTALIGLAWWWWA